MARLFILVYGQKWYVSQLCTSCSFYIRFSEIKGPRGAKEIKVLCVCVLLRYCTRNHVYNVFLNHLSLSFRGFFCIPYWSCCCCCYGDNNRCLPSRLECTVSFAGELYESFVGLWKKKKHLKWRKYNQHTSRMNKNKWSFSMKEKEQAQVDTKKNTGRGKKLYSGQLVAEIQTNAYLIGFFPSNVCMILIHSYWITFFGVFLWYNNLRSLNSGFIGFNSVVFDDVNEIF